MDNNMGINEYMKFNQFYYLVGIVIFLLSILIGTFQMIVMLKGNKCCIRNLQTSKIQNWEVKMNLFWVLLGTILLIAINIMLMINQAKF